MSITLLKASRSSMQRTLDVTCWAMRVAKSAAKLCSVVVYSVIVCSMIVCHVVVCSLIVYFHSNMHIIAALSWCSVVTSEMAHTGIRRTVSLHSEHVYKDNVWVETSVRIKYCAIFRCTTNAGHHRRTYTLSHVLNTLSQNVSW